MRKSRSPGTTLTLLLIATALTTLLMAMPAWALLVALVVLALWMIFSRLGRQTASVTHVGIATLSQRLGSASVVVMSIAEVVAVLVALLAMGAGFERTLKQTGSDDTALILRAGAKVEAGSSLSSEAVAIASQATEILRDASNRPIASPEQLVIASLPKRSTGLDAFIAMRGVDEQGWKLRSEVTITAGRKFKTGLRELIVGQDAQQKFSGLNIGSTLTFNNQPWTVVGAFNSGDAHNSELWGDAGVIRSTYRLEGANSLSARLTSASALNTLQATLASDPRLQVDVQTTRQFYNRQSERFAKLIRIVGATIGGLMAIGALFGALNATYTAVASRTREIATLRAMGFRSVPVISSVLMETVLLATVGGGLGALTAWLAFDGYLAATAGASGQIVFAFDVSPALLWEGLRWALAIGLVGGLFPAVRAARMPIAVGLRAL